MEYQLTLCTIPKQSKTALKSVLPELWSSFPQCIIIGVLIRKETFIREFLTSLSADTAMLNFFLEPQKNRFADEFIYLDIPRQSPIWKLLGVITLEYANKTEDTQQDLQDGQ